MGDKEDYVTQYRVFFENFAATVNPEDQLPVNIAGYTITEAEVPGEVLYWTTQYLTEKQCPQTLLTPLRRIILDEVRVASKKAPNEFGYKSDESVYVALRLMQAVTARVNAICLRYLDNSRLDTLPPPPPLSQRDMKTVSCATKNSRRAMEDRHVEIGNLEALFGIETTEPTSFYAVYDGHAGSAAATYCAAHLHQYLVESPDFKTDLKRAMREAFLRTDAEFIRKSDQERANGGSTAVAIAVRGRQLLAAWAGDSLALLAKRMRLLQLVRPHKPSREDERKRVESSGGTVLFWGTWRVNGQLAVSRAIGDAQYKPFVTARPETSIVDLDGDEDFVVVACDGLWDFVSEDDVALAIYRQLLADPDDLKAVTKRLIVQAKRQGSADNISIIVVFLKDPRDIAADNCPPMDLGLDNPLPNASPFGMEAEACKLQPDALSGGGGPEAGADNGVDNSDSDSEDLGPETAVDVDADDLDADVRLSGPAPPTPPAHTNEFEDGAEMRVEEGHVDGALVDNVAESGEESEDEWNYFKGEGEREEQNPSEEQDEPPRSETPCQDNSAWETSSVDMNSSPLNPDAPVFVPGSVAGSDVLLAESPRKPLPMDDIELPDVAQFETEAVVRPAELLDLDNCDQLNGHHNVSLDEVKEQLNGNNKYNMDSLGFGFSVGTEPDKVTDTGLIHDFERIQKDTTDFCNIQVFQTHTETNPFATEDNDELLERLKNKERDPMNMSFYQEKDDDTCERLVKNDPDDLNAVQQLPDSDDDDIQPNGVFDNVIENDKENINPEQHTDLLGAAGDIPEPNNDIIMFDERKDIVPNNAPLNFGQGDNFMDYNVNSSNNMQGYSNIEFESSNVSQDTVAHTDTPESHKLLFEQIPEIPDGKSSELGFSTEDLLDQTESEKDARILTPQEELSQDIDMESKNEDSPCIEGQELMSKAEEDQHVQSQILEDNINDDIIPEPDLLDEEINLVSTDRLPASPLPSDDRLAEVISPEVSHNIENSVKVDIHQSFEEKPIFNTEIVLQENDNKEIIEEHIPLAETSRETPDIKIEEPIANDADLTETYSAPSESPLPAESPIPSHSPVPSEPHVEAEIDAHTESPAPAKSPMLPVEATEAPASISPEPAISPEHPKSPEPAVASPEPAQATPSPRPLTPEVELNRDPPAESSEPAASPLPADVPLPRESPPPAASPLPVDCSLPVEPPTPREATPPLEELHPAEATLRPETASPLGEPAPPALDDAHDRLAADAAPAPDIVPEPRSELVTDIDIGIPESRAQEICVPVTSEIEQEEAVRPAATPPPTPAVDAPAAAAPPAFDAAPVADAPIAADAEPAVAAALAVGAVAAAAVTAAKKTPATKKSPTTASPRPAATKTPAKLSTTASPRTPASATKKAAPPTPGAARPAAARTSTSAPKPPAPAAPKAPAASRISAAKPSTVSARAPAKTTAAPGVPKPATTKAASPTKPAPARPAAAPKAPAPRPATAAAPKPASRPAAAPRPAPARPTPASAPTSRLAPAAAKPKPADPKPKPIEKKPLTNGDIKEAKPAPSRPAVRAAPRPTPRAPAAPAAPAAAKPAAPRPAPRAPRPLDKQTKDLTNKRITTTTKAAPPRTATTKAPPKGSVPTKVTRKSAEARPNGLANGAQSPIKPPPSPPPADNALLPDVIA